MKYMVEVDRLYSVPIESPQINRDNQSDLDIIQVGCFILILLRDVITAIVKARLTMFIH